jgi:hypothetical protein
VTPARNPIFALALACLLALPALAAPATNLLDFGSEAGMARLAEAGMKADFAALANHFEAQSNALFCGPTTATIVLNALQARLPGLPRDRSRLRPEDHDHLPPGADISLPRYTQDMVIERGAKPRARVLGGVSVDGCAPRRDPGYQLRQLDELLRANGAKTTLVVVDDAMPDAQIREALRRNLGQAHDYVVVNYLRSAAGQPGGGHISPLGAYDEASDSFLVMDVNPAAYGWVWMPAPALIRGMRSFDTHENRGYILVSPR